MNYYGHQFHSSGLISLDELHFEMLERVLELGQSAGFASQKIGASLCDMVAQLGLGWSIYLGRLGVRFPPLPAVGCLLGLTYAIF